MRFGYCMPVFGGWLRNVPKPARPPTVYMGGESPRAKDIIAAGGDAYVMHGDPPDIIAGKVADMAARRQAAGRPPLTFGVSGYVVCRDTEDAAKGLRAGLIGTPAQITARIRAYEQAGVDLMLLQFSPQHEEMARFGETVIAGYAAR